MKKIGYGKLAALSFTLSISLPTAFIVAGTTNESIQDVVLDVSFVLLWISIAFFVVWLVVRRKATAEKRAEKRVAQKLAHDRQRELQRQHLAERKAAKKAAQEKLRERQKRDWEEMKSPEYKAYRERTKKMEEARKADDKRPVSAVLISTTTHRSALSTVSRAILGGAILGPVGAIGGAASGTSKPTHATFNVKYASGRTATETVPVTSKRFDELSALLHKNITP